MSNSSSVLHLGQMVQNEHEAEDRLSSLPDDILISILQLIDINDATRTSILSRRWRFLAAYSYFTVLDLDASLVDCKNHFISYKDAKPKFLNWVHKMHCLAAQLTKLNLQMINCSYGDPHLLPCFPNVKDLELQVTVGLHRFDQSHMNLLRLRRYAEACPVLDNLKLQIEWSCDCDKLYDRDSDDVDFDSDYDSDLDLDSDSGQEEYSLEEVKQWLEEKDEGVNNATLPLLRKLEWTAAFSHHVQAEYELALYIVRNAVMLEKFICDPRFKDENWDHFDSMDDIEDNVRRQRARELATAIPSRIDFTVL